MPASVGSQRLLAIDHLCQRSPLMSGDLLKHQLSAVLTLSLVLGKLVVLIDLLLGWKI